MEVLEFHSVLQKIYADKKYFCPLEVFYRLVGDVVSHPDGLIKHNRPGTDIPVTDALQLQAMPF